MDGRRNPKKKNPKKSPVVYHYTNYFHPHFKLITSENQFIVNLNAVFLRRPYFPSYGDRNDS